MQKTLISLVIICACATILAGCNGSEESFSMSLPTSKPATLDVKTLKPKAIMILQNSLKDDHPGVRANAIEIVVEANRKELMSYVVDLLKDPSVPVRFGAAMAIGDMECFGCQQ